MGQMLCIVLVALLFVFPLAAFAVEPGAKAPAFEAESTTGTIRLEDYIGKKNVLLAFYYKDFTGG